MAWPGMPAVSRGPPGSGACGRRARARACTVPRSSVIGPTRKKRTLPCGRASPELPSSAVNACTWLFPHAGAAWPAGSATTRIVACRLPGLYTPPAAALAAPATLAGAAGAAGAATGAVPASAAAVSVAAAVSAAGVILVAAAPSSPARTLRDPLPAAMLTGMAAAGPPAFAVAEPAAQLAPAGALGAATPVLYVGAAPACAPPALNVGLAPAWAPAALNFGAGGPAIACAPPELNFGAAWPCAEAAGWMPGVLPLALAPPRMPSLPLLPATTPCVPGLVAFMPAAGALLRPRASSGCEAGALAEPAGAATDVPVLLVVLFPFAFFALAFLRHLPFLFLPCLHVLLARSAAPTAGAGASASSPACCADARAVAPAALRARGHGCRLRGARRAVPCLRQGGQYRAGHAGRVAPRRGARRLRGLLAERVRQRRGR